MQSVCVWYTEATSTVKLCSQNFQNLWSICEIENFDSVSLLVLAVMLICTPTKHLSQGHS